MIRRGQGRNGIAVEKTLSTAGVIPLLALGVSLPVFAQHKPGSHGGDRRAVAAYDTTSEASFEGIVADVTTGTADGQCGQQVTQILLSTEKGTQEVQLGPTAFVTESRIEIKRGDALTVTGSSVIEDGSAVVLARELRKGDEAWTLRDAAGVPLWTSAPKARCGPGWKKVLLMSALVAKVVVLAVLLE